MQGKGRGQGHTFGAPLGGSSQAIGAGALVPCGLWSLVVLVHWLQAWGFGRCLVRPTLL